MDMRAICLGLVYVISSLVSAQSVVKRHSTIKKISASVNIDGYLDESFWEDQAVFKDFINQWPVDSGLADAQTEVRMAFDDQFLYIGATLYDVGNNHIIRTLKRDQDDEYFGSDGIGVILDPIDKKTNGFFFGVNAGGAQIEALARINGSNTSLDPNWDNKWYSAITQGDSIWFVEMAIPFRTLRYDPDNTTWGINFVRNDMKSNVYSSWNPVPVNLNTIDLGYTGQVNWDSPPPPIKNGAVNLIPYIAGSANKDFETDVPTGLDGNIGVDAKLALSSSLNLDLTLNPDFSTVDVDVQQTNLTRFSLFFPERRGFFQENSDLFTSFGLRTINPFFSRRIGLVDGETIPILFGARLSGNLSERFRIGLMNVQTASAPGINPQNFGIAAFQQRLGSRSSINGLFANRQSTSLGENENQQAYNRVGALQLNLLSADGKLAADLGFQKSINPENLNQEEYYSGTLRYNSKRLFVRLTAHQVGRDFITDVGFVPRLLNYDAARDTTIRRQFTQLAYLFVYNFFPKSGPFNIHGPRLSSTYVLNPDGSINGSFEGLFYYWNFKNQNEMEVRLTLDRDNLPFDSFIAGDIPFPADNYTYPGAGAFFRTNPRKRLSSFTNINYGEFFSGKRFRFTQRVTYRIQPWGNFSLSYTLNEIDLPETLDSTTLHLLGITKEISFSNRMFWTTFIQANTQIENVNINSRFQWRYRPMSDLFIVYTENFASQHLRVKNRGVVMKLTYWL